MAKILHTDLSPPGCIAFFRRQSKMLAAAAVLFFGATLAFARPSSVDADVAFFDPTANGGSWLDNAGDGFGEPLNVRVGNLGYALPLLKSS